MSQAECEVCGNSGVGVLFPMFPKTDSYRFGTVCETCDNDADDAKTERQVDALEDNGREYPKGYDGTGAW